MIPIPGHLAGGIIIYKVFRLEALVVLLATFFPDLFDKPLRYVFHIFPFGRNVMHSLPGLFFVSAAVFAFWGRKKGVSWAAGHFGHIVCDGIADMVSAGKVFIPWLFPFVMYDFPHTSGFSIDWWELALEAGLSVIACVLIWPDRQAIFLRLRKLTHKSVP